VCVCHSSCSIKLFFFLEFFSETKERKKEKKGRPGKQGLRHTAGKRGERGSARSPLEISLRAVPPKSLHATCVVKLTD
jgi:hypothetical protein